MLYTVFLQNSEDSTYLASTSSWPTCIGKGRSREEALENIRKKLKEMLKNVVEITQVKIDVPKIHHSKSWMPICSVSDPWLEFRGMFADDPDFDDFLSEIEAYREELDNE